MNRSELAAVVAEKNDITKKDAEIIVKAVFDTIAENLNNGEKVTIAGFGTFEVTEREAREARNPRSGEIVSVPAGKSPKFKAGKNLKDMINA